MGDSQAGTENELSALTMETCRGVSIEFGQDGLVLFFFTEKQKCREQYDIFFSFT